MRRWLGAVELLALGRAAAQRGGVADRTVGLILVDAAIEGLLGTIAGLPGDPVDGRYPQLPNQALKVLASRKLSVPGLNGAIARTHEARNGAVHHGADPSVETVATGIDAGSRLLDIMPRLSGSIPAVQAGSGILAAVAAVVESVAPDLAAELREADAAATAGEADRAADAGARALRATIARIRPRLAQGWASPSVHSRDPLRDVFEQVGSRLDRIEAWVVPLALGITPADHDDLLTDLGRAMGYLDGSVRVARLENVSLQEVRHALDLLAQVVFRAWEAGALVPGDEVTLHRTHRPQRRQSGS